MDRKTMDVSRSWDIISILGADANSIITLSAEVCDAVESDTNDYYKTHAIYTIAEHQNQLLDELDGLVLQVISDKPEEKES